MIRRGRVVYADHGVEKYRSRAVWQVTIHAEGCPQLKGDLGYPLSVDERQELRQHGTGTYFGNARTNPPVHVYVLCRTCKPDTTEELS